MSSIPVISATILAALLTSACQSGDGLGIGVVGREPPSQRELAALAVNKNYALAMQTITSRGVSRAPANNTAAGPTAPKATDVFGPQFSRYFLSDDFVVYRHGKQADPVPLAAATANDTSLGPIDQPPPYELTYFLVSPDGIVADYAVGSVPAAQNGCVRFVAASVSQCESASRLSADLERFDTGM
ncbi:MAG: hypothetical protein AAFO77_06995, partial [Pseudomonadota bacterium]